MGAQLLECRATVELEESESVCPWATDPPSLCPSRDAIPEGVCPVLSRASQKSWFKSPRSVIIEGRLQVSSGKKRLRRSTAIPAFAHLPKWRIGHEHRAPRAVVRDPELVDICRPLGPVDHVLGEADPAPHLRSPRFDPGRPDWEDDYLRVLSIHSTA